MTSIDTDPPVYPGSLIQGVYWSLIIAVDKEWYPYILFSLKIYDAQHEKGSHAICRQFALMQFADNLLSCNLWTL